MKTILVSIISDQTIPNVLVIKEMYGLYDDLLFITSEYVEKKGLDKWIEMACGLKADSVKRIKVVEDDLDDVRTKLANLDCADTKYIINMSGGTKIMTIGVYEFFAKNNNKIFYVPIGKNIMSEVFPNSSSFNIAIEYRLNLMEYLMSYGLYYQSDESLIYNEEYTSRFFEQFKRKKFNFFAENRIIDSHELESKKDKTYFSGKWFEEYFYSKLKKELQIEDNSIALSVKLFRDIKDVQHDNEYDVVFVFNNELYVIECKASVGSKATIKNNLDAFMYKLAAITRDFGLRVHSNIVTLTNIEKNAGNKLSGIYKKSRILGISNILDAEFFLKSEEVSSNLINK
ncbi:MAG: DUF1887 family CARF protein [Bacteroidales bacterium]|nr:DUF1887 family CARF protein [Bacteroidales bacterium]